MFRPLLQLMAPDTCLVSRGGWGREEELSLPASKQRDKELPLSPAPTPHQLQGFQQGGRGKPVAASCQLGFGQPELMGILNWSPAPALPTPTPSWETAGSWAGPMRQGAYDLHPPPAQVGEASLSSWGSGAQPPSHPLWLGYWGELSQACEGKGLESFLPSSSGWPKPSWQLNAAGFSYPSSTLPPCRQPQGWSWAEEAQLRPHKH